METLVIHIPEKKKAMVKQLLIDLGVRIHEQGKDLKNGSARDFLGRFSAEDAKAINTAIEEGCEKIDLDGWN